MTNPERNPKNTPHYLRGPRRRFRRPKLKVSPLQITAVTLLWLSAEFVSYFH